MKKQEKVLDEKALVELTLGHREPETEDEKILAKEIEEIEKEGYIVDIPGEWP